MVLIKPPVSTRTKFIPTMTEYQQEEMNLIVALLKTSCTGSNARETAMACNSVERSVRAFCCPSKSSFEKNEIFTQAHVCERLKCLNDVCNHWSWIGHWEVANDGVTEDISFGEYLYEKLTTEEKLKSFKILTNCTCCKRHQDLHGINKQNYVGCRRCSCKCRHYSRWLRRFLLHDGIEPSQGVLTDQDVSGLRPCNEVVDHY